ncbi:MAG TPA: hypothetical protein VMU15_20820 [Anaeromyxobacter sp.]|nr:hypothetical protein [Anaeromyxobacter sp.]
MPAAALLLASALAAGQAGGTCHFVGSGGIATLPCGSSPEAVSAAERRTARPAAGGTAAGREAAGPAVREPAPQAAPAPAGPGDLAERVEAMEREVARLEVERQAAEAARARAERERAEALQELSGIRQELAEARDRAEQADRARQAEQASLDEAATSLLQADGVLATGSAGEVAEALDRATAALAAAHSRDGTAWVAAAQDALGQGDYFTARQAIRRAAQAAVRAQP